MYHNAYVCGVSVERVFYIFYKISSFWRGYKFYTYRDIILMEWTWCRIFYIVKMSPFWALEPGRQEIRRFLVVSYFVTGFRRWSSKQMIVKYHQPSAFLQENRVFGEFPICRYLCWLAFVWCSGSRRRLLGNWCQGIACLLWCGLTPDSTLVSL